MKLKDKVVNFSRWDSYSFVIFLIIIIFQAFKWRIFPIFIDIYYHLLTAVGFNEAGGWVSRCFWEYAPIGRPQLYPPLLHIVMLFFLKLGIPILVIGKLIQFIIYPLLLFIIWYVIREIFDKRQAFFTLVMIFSIYSFYLTSINTSASSLALVFCLLSLLFLERNKIITSTIFLAIGFYTHGYTSWLFLCVFLFYGILNRKIFFSCLKIIIGAVVLAAPLITFQFIHRDYFLFQKDIHENYYIEFNLLDWMISPFGLVTCLRKKKGFLILFALFGSSMILLLSGAIFRFLTFYGIVSIIFMNAVFLSDLFQRLNRIKNRIYFIIFIILLFVFAPTLTIDMSGIKETNLQKTFFKNDITFTLDYFDSTFINFILYGNRYNFKGNELNIYFPGPFKEMANVIKKNTDKRDIIYVNFPYTAGILSLLSGRAISTAMLSEIKPYKPFDKIDVSKLIIWQKNPKDLLEEPYRLIYSYNLKKIADTELAFIYENPKCHFKKQTSSATISYKILFMLLFSVFLFLLWDIKFGIDKY